MNTLTEPIAGTLTSGEHPVLLFFDGECAFCNRWVNRIKDADGARRIRYGVKQGATFQKLAQEHPEVAKVDSIVVVSRNEAGCEEILMRSRAVKVIVEGLPGFGFFAFLLRIVPAPICDIGYRLFAKVRGPLFGKLDRCRVPTQEERKLFVD